MLLNSFVICLHFHLSPRLMLVFECWNVSFFLFFFTRHACTNRVHADAVCIAKCFRTDQNMSREILWMYDNTKEYDMSKSKRQIIIQPRHSLKNRHTRTQQPTKTEIHDYIFRLTNKCLNFKMLKWWKVNILKFKVESCREDMNKLANTLGLLFCFCLSFYWGIIMVTTISNRVRIEACIGKWEWDEPLWPPPCVPVIPVIPVVPVMPVIPVIPPVTEFGNVQF